MYLSLGTRVTALHYCCPAVTGNETLQSNTNNTTPSAHQQRALLARRWQITFVDVNCGLWMCCKHQSLVLNVLWLDSVFTDWAVGWGLCLQKSLSPDQQTCQWRRWPFTFAVSLETWQMWSVASALRPCQFVRVVCADYSEQKKPQHISSFVPQHNMTWAGIEALTGVSC